MVDYFVSPVANYTLFTSGVLRPGLHRTDSCRWQCLRELLGGDPCRIKTHASRDTETTRLDRRRAGKVKGFVSRHDIMFPHSKHSAVANKLRGSQLRCRRQRSKTKRSRRRPEKPDQTVIPNPDWDASEDGVPGKMIDNRQIFPYQNSSDKIFFSQNCQG